MKRKVRMIVATVCTIAIAGLFLKPEHVNVYAKSYGVEEVVESETVLSVGDVLLVPTSWETDGMHVYFYNAEGGSLKNENVEKGKNYTIPAYTATLFGPLPEGSKFSGWKVIGKPANNGNNSWMLELMLSEDESGENTPKPSSMPEATEEPTDTPTPAVTEEPTDTPTPAVTEEPTDMPTPAVTEEPTDTPTPVVTEEPTDTPIPEETEKPAGTPSPVVTEEPAGTTAPVATNEPAATMRPVVTEKPASTPTPAETTSPVETEKPAQTTPPIVTEKPAQTMPPVVTEEPTQTPAATEEPAITPEPTQTPGEDTDHTMIKNVGVYQLQPMIKYSLQGGVTRVEGDITRYANPIEFTVEAGGLFTFY